MIENFLSFLPKANAPDWSSVTLKELEKRVKMAKCIEIQ